MCEALVGYTTDRELHPAPKVFIWLLPLDAALCEIITQLRFDDALDRANGYTLG